MVPMLLRDLLWAARHARRRPLFGAAVVATLTLGIAATTIAWGLATAVLWRPLPFGQADRLVFVWEASPQDGDREPFRVTSGRFAEWRDRARSFESLSMFGAAGFSMDTAGGVFPLRGVRTSANFFDTLGVRPALGRTFSPSDEVPGQHQVLIASHAFWQRHLGGRPDAIGATIRLNGTPYTVIGVMPPIVFPGWPVNPATVTIDADSRELWVPIARTPQLDSSTRAHVFGAIARLAPGVTREQASDELMRLGRPDAAEPHGGITLPLREQFVRDARVPLLALVGAALALLIVACANLAALQVSAFEARRGELAIRAAIGASAGRLASQLSAESLLLAGVAGGAALLVARYGLTILPEALPPDLPLLTPAAVDWRVAASAAVATLGSGLLVAAWPIGRLLAAGPAPRGVADEPRRGVFRVLIAGQVAVTIALGTAAALLLQSLWVVRQRDPGFVLDGVVTAQVGLPAAINTPEAAVAAEALLVQTAAGRAGIRRAAAAYDHPLEANWTDSFGVGGTSDGAEAEVRGQAQLRIVSPSYFDALGVELLEGRLFTDSQGHGRPGVAVVNEAFAVAHGPSILGRQLQSASARLTWGDGVPSHFEVIGVVENERFRGLEQPAEPAVYLSTRQFPQTSFVLLLRTTAEAATMREVRSLVRSVEPSAVVDTPITLMNILSQQLATRRIAADVVASVASAALFLVALGVYGVLAMVVASRTREIGIRLALGATPADAARRVIGESLLNVTLGIVAGLGLALLAGRALESVLVGVSGRDPATLAVVSATLLAAALASAIVPAARAARVDPAATLRGE
ncbi:MAG TPA: ADOP family duplicated permease [Vicinamibacterales bacterium]|nr:ADOP family duplicated permease [Vicinamibacterales bacterium]